VPVDPDCHICGTCWWVDCANDADYAIDVALKRKNLPLYNGRVDLCAGHYRLAYSRNGRLNLNWVAIEQAIAKDKAKA
jgi:hypothetical protein